MLAPDLYDSLCCFHCRRGSLSRDITKVVFSNFVQSGLSKLMLLCEKGMKAEQAIKTWNDQATKESQLLGQQRVALLALLGAPKGTAELLQHASHYGSQSAFSEERFANKSLFPGSAPRCQDKSRSKRSKVTEAGWYLFLSYVASHAAKMPENRAKLSKDRGMQLDGTAGGAHSV